MEASYPRIADDRLWGLERLPVDDGGGGLRVELASAGEVDEGRVVVDVLGVANVHGGDDL